MFNLQAGKNIQASQIHDVSTGDDYLCYGGNVIRGYVGSYNHDGDYPIIGRQGALCGNINRANGKFYATEHAVCVDTYADTDISWAYLFLTALNLNQYATAISTDGPAKPVKSRDSGDEDPILHLVCTFYKDLYYARGIKMIRILFVCWGNICQRCNPSCHELSENLINTGNSPL